ncbi:hypothetical protein F5883DRAFT_640201 [Diaporthe sp. PMI_573]|nr:hypothetical protein F5883DRAFT_640201 [Diaporthaceae sp. PMI_573]
MAKENPLDKAIQRVLADYELDQAVKKYDIEFRTHGPLSIKVAIRWAAHHSALGDEDSIIFGIMALN